MTRKKVEEEQPQSLLGELCGDDEHLHAFLGSHLYQTPLAAISQKGLDALVEEAEESGDFRQAFDKAIFEGAQNPGQRGRYIEVIRGLASKGIDAAEQARGEAEAEGLVDHAASLARRIEDYRFMSERAGDILTVASSFYTERLVESEEEGERKARREERKQLEREERQIGEHEKSERAARRKERRSMSRSERREARRREKTEDAAAKDRRRVRKEHRAEAERKEQTIGDVERAARDERKEGRRGY